MAQIDTRHFEMRHLFSLLKANHKGEAIDQIAELEASMEKEDIETVWTRFEKWKTERAAESSK
jgi:hypothetical protein